MTNFSEMSGLELLHAMLAGKIPPPSIASTMPMTLLEASHGYCRFSAVAGAQHLNPLGGVHGGFAATVLDSVTGCAVHTTLGPGIGYGTIDLNVKMLKPVPKEASLNASGKVLHSSRSLAVAEGSLLDQDDNLLAHATATCKIIAPRRSLEQP